MTPLQLRKVPSILFKAHLTQIVVNKEVIAPQASQIRVWILSERHMIQDFQTAQD